MNEIMTVRIAGWRCQAFHGVYPQEPRSGGEFEVNLDVGYAVREVVRDLRETISYVDLLEILRQHMQHPRPLLETVAMEAVADIKQHYPSVVEIRLSIYKLQAPIAGFQGRVGIDYHKKFNA